MTLSPSSISDFRHIYVILKRWPVLNHNWEERGGALGRRRRREETNPRCSWITLFAIIDDRFFFHRTNRFNKQVFIGYNGRTSEKIFFFFFFFFCNKYSSLQSRAFLINLHLTRQIFSSRINCIVERQCDDSTSINYYREMRFAILHGMLTLYLWSEYGGKNKIEKS